MSREYIDNPAEDQAFSLRHLVEATERIADTLDDYMEMSLAGIELTHALQAADPETGELLRPLTDVLTAIRARRRLALETK